jgi:hypothetical protein
MTDESTLALLREIRDNQREALQVQREHITMYQRQLDRIDGINDRAESIQRRAGGMQKFILWIALPLMTLALLLLIWSFLRG